MKKLFYVMLPFCVVLFFSITVFASLEEYENCFWCGFSAAHPIYVRYREIENKIFPMLYSVALCLVGIFTTLSIITAIKMRGKVKIIFKENGKIVKKYVKLIPSENTQVIFEDKRNRYECTSNEIIKIQKRNKFFLAIIVLFSIEGLCSLIDFNVVHYYIHNEFPYLFAFIPLTIFVLLIFLIITLIKNKGKVKIFFKKEGRVIKKYVKLISFVEKEVVFEDKKNRYECVPNKIVKIQKLNKSFVALLVVLSVVGIFSFISDFAWTIVDDGVMYD